MIWQDNTMTMEEEEHKLQPLQHQGCPTNDSGTEEIERKKAIQLQKYQDPSHNQNRQVIIAIMNRFGELLVHGATEDIVRDLMTEDYEAFMFSSTGRNHLRYSTPQRGFIELCKGVRILERWVRDTNVDVEKSTGIQISICRIFYEEDDTFADEVVFEVFSIKNERISKYRASFAEQIQAHGEDPWEVSFKDMILARVKELNYAWAGQPDLEKLASFFDENTEYTIWRWDDNKNFIFNKQNFVQNFPALEENMIIKCVVPYEVYSERHVAAAPYVFHLESKATKEKFVWVSMILYQFDHNLKPKKIRHQGELHPETKDIIPHECFDRKDILQKIEALYSNMLGQFDLFYNDVVDFKCKAYLFGPREQPLIGYLQGTKIIETAISQSSPLTLEWLKIVDIFVDQQDPCYEVVVYLGLDQGKKKLDVGDLPDQSINRINFVKMFLEKGKIIKAYTFTNNISELIPSPFDGKEVKGVNIYQRESVQNS